MSGGLFESLSVGSRGLSASQTALSVTGQNITNANTEGYSRKRLEQSADWKRDGQFGQMGFGVEVDQISRVRDQLLDHTIVANQGDVGMHTQVDDAMGRMEALFTEPTEQGLGESLTSFWNAWQDLANHPSDVAARQSVVDKAQTAIARFHQLANGLQGLRGDEEIQLAAKVKDVNDLLTRISDDNQAVAAAESQPSGKANDSRDDRQLALSKLGKLLDIDYVEDAQGRVTVTSSGQMLVAPSKPLPLLMEHHAVALADGASFTLSSLRVSGTNCAFVPKNGELAGLLEARDRIIPGAQGKLDSLASSLVASLNQLHRSGYDAVGTTGTNFFDPTKTSAATIALLSEIAKNPLALAAGSGGTSLSPSSPVSTAIPATGAALDLAQSVDPAYRDLLDGSVKIKTVGPPSVELTEGPGKDFVVDKANGRISFTNYIAFPAGTAVTVDFRYSVTGFKGAGDGNNALAIAQLKDSLLANPDQHGIPTATIVNAYADMVGSIGANHSTARSKLGTSKSLSDFYGRQAQSVAGVNIDEEVTDLVKYQHSYQASAKYISTVSQMLESLLNL